MYLIGVPTTRNATHGEKMLCADGGTAAAPAATFCSGIKQ